VLIPNEVQKTSQTIYYSKPLEKIQDVIDKEFYDLRRVDVRPVIVTDDIVLRRQRSIHPTNTTNQAPRS
jgi:hypothetical protein